MNLEEIAEEAANLPEEKRAPLASRLLHALESPVYDVPDEEIRRRVREAEEDQDVMITFDELVVGRACPPTALAGGSRTNRWS